VRRAVAFEEQVCMYVRVYVCVCVHVYMTMCLHVWRQDLSPALEEEVRQAVAFEEQIMTYNRDYSHNRVTYIHTYIQVKELGHRTVKVQQVAHTHTYMHAYRSKNLIIALSRCSKTCKRGSD
jgi:hypothetical protein